MVIKTVRVLGLLVAKNSWMVYGQTFYAAEKYGEVVARSALGTEKADFILDSTAGVGQSDLRTYALHSECGTAEDILKTNSCSIS